MRPARRFLVVLALFLVAAALLSMLRLWVPTIDSTYLGYAWWLSFAAFVMVSMLDLGSRKALDELSVERVMPGNLSLGVSNRVTLRVANQLARRLMVEVIDLFPPQVRVQGLPYTLAIPATTATDIHYHVYPVQRGDAEFGPVQLRVLSRWRLWEYRISRSARHHTRIYPNFAGIKRYQDLRHEQQIAQLGVHIRQRRGEGSDFHQLREYREGDPLRQVDWKASSRHHRLISREYQDERDQEIIFMLDCGRRMRSKDDELSHFDHALNALLLMSYVALKQGDGIGMMTFAGTDRWLSPVKGVASINVLLNRLYDIHTGTATTDISEAAERLMQHHRKRALVICLSNISPEDADDLLGAAEMLRKRHLLMVVSLREEFLDRSLRTPVSDFATALDYCGSAQLEQQRKRLIDRMLSRGLHVLDTPPKTLPINLVNKYWELKRGGLI